MSSPSVRLSDTEVVIWDASQNVRKKVNFSEVLNGHEFAVVFTVPAAYTPVCSEKHFPGFISHKDELNKMACKVICVSTDKIPSLEAWKKSFEGADHITMVSDCFGSFGQATNLTMSNHSTLGSVLNRSSLIFQKGVLKKSNIEKGPSECTISHADEVMRDIRKISNELEEEKG
jgi:peroxiredoxin